MEAQAKEKERMPDPETMARHVAPWRQHDSAMNVMAAIEAPPSVNPLARSLGRRPMPDPEELICRIRAGDRGALSRGITLVESDLPTHREVAARLLNLALIDAPASMRLGITGVPGVGKSTLIETLGLSLLSADHRLAVLTIDPSSAATRGSILGDKSRMGQLSNHDRAFIRPSPTGGALGGVAHQTREAISLFEAAGYDVIIVETVGVGQSETAVYGMVDCFLLLMLGGAGDELQGIKRGIMERADLIAVTKADGDNLVRAEVAVGQVRAALRFLAAPAGGLRTEVMKCSAFDAAGVADLWAALERFFVTAREKGSFETRRCEQAVYWMRDLVQESILRSWRSRPGLVELRSELEDLVRQGVLTPRSAAERLLAL